MKILDLNKNEVVEIQDFGKVPIPPDDGNYSQKYQKEFRKDLKPIEITHPEGPSFTVDRNEVKWQKWHLRVGFTNREGLVIHNVSYEDNGKIRPILYRASLSEMIVPYGDPTNDHYKKQVFDAGEVGIGTATPSADLHVENGSNNNTGHFKMGHTRQRRGYVGINSSQTRWYKIMNYATGEIFTGVAQLFHQRGGGYNQTGAYRTYNMSVAGYNLSLIHI